MRLHRMRRGSSLVLVVTVGLLLAACTGPSDDATGTTLAEKTPTPTAQIVARSPHDLHSYRYTVSVSLVPTVLDISEAPSGLPLDETINIDIEGERVNPDREHAISSVDVGFLQLQTEWIEVSGRRWTRRENGTWSEGGAPGVGALTGLDFRPASVFLDDSGQYDEVARHLEVYPWERETLSGREARHFTLTQDEFQDLFQGQNQIVPSDVGATLAAEIWLDSATGTPVRLLVTGTDTEGVEVLRLEMELRDLDSEEITVEPPE